MVTRTDGVTASSDAVTATVVGTDMLENAEQKVAVMVESQAALIEFVLEKNRMMLPEIRRGVVAPGWITSLKASSQMHFAVALPVNVMRSEHAK